MSNNEKNEMNSMDNMIVTLSNGVRCLNSSPHPFVFEDDTTVPFCGTTLNATFEESEAPFGDGTMSEVTFVVTEKQPTEEGIAFLDTVPDGVLVLGSAIAAEAYGFPVVMAKPTPETAGRDTAPADKRMCIGTFTRFLVPPVTSVKTVSLSDL
jgi:hypothetical protein